IIEAMNVARQDISLDDEIQHTDSLSYKDVMKDESVESPEEVFFRKRFIELIKQGMQYLNPRERDIVRLYFGIDGENPHTLEDIGKMMGLSRERVRQLRNRALDKLRNYIYGEKKD
ncbi:MAG TPA: sigma-70 family RNA polymerase sigma factor, partial [candidate division WOR-3 bacterium]|nr:sigma-70 family RNA polymerase sigma factor [candidate division WOR-3 bacterium]